jgi:ribosomal protein S18 acetylase RimI-like enzyme
MDLRALRMNECEKAGQIVGENAIWRDRYHYQADACGRDLLYATTHGDYVLGAFEGTEMLGFLWIVPKGGFARSPYLRLIAVSTKSQSRGTGGALLDEAERHFKGSAKHLFLMVSDFNARAQAFYASRGYEKAGAVPAFVLPDVAEEIWFKAL